MALYDTIGRGYRELRRPDPRIAAAIDEALGDATTVVNVGAGAGSYEPMNRTVLAIEPSEVMIRQRPAPPLAAPCIQGSADALPVESRAVDAAMTVLSAHHWPDLERGLREMARVATRRLVIMTWVPDSPEFWLTRDYFPEVLAHDRTIFPPSQSLQATLERLAGPTRVAPVPVPHDCTDGFLCAYWKRPDAYLRDDARAAISSFSRINAAPGLQRLRADLDRGLWASRNAHLANLDAIDAGYRLFVTDLTQHPAR